MLNINVNINGIWIYMLSPYMYTTIAGFIKLYVDILLSMIHNIPNGPYNFVCICLPMNVYTI